ncbi:MAG: TlpA family protein disulfide reductase [Bdellovibrio sp.]|nr:TlpA family protein disulfide reductase [Bdellovibrio sp.]
MKRIYGLMFSIIFLNYPVLAGTFSYTSFSLPLFQSEETFISEQHVGKKIVVINFFASWCSSCIQELPELRALKEKYSGPDYLFIAVNAGESDSVIKKFLKKYAFPYLIVKDPERLISKKLGVDELPRTIVIDRTGKIIFDGNRPPSSIP